MRTLIPGGGAALLVAATLAVPAGAAVPIDGSHYDQSNVSQLSQGCVDSHAHPVTAPKLLIQRGPGKPPIGHYSNGFKPATGGFGAGWAAHVSHPATISTFRAQIFAPSKDASGHAVVFFHEAGDSGYWFGNADLGSSTGKGWRSTGNAANLTYSWLHFPDESTASDRDAFDQTIQSFASAHGGDADGAEMGFVYGCDGNTFFVDALRLKTGSDDTTYDFGGFRTSSQAYFPKSPSNFQVAITVGGKKAVAGQVFNKGRSQRLAGVMKIQAKPAKGGSFKTIAKGKTTKTSRFTTKVAPLFNTAYRAYFVGDRTHEPSDSGLVYVYVRMLVKASFADATVTRGHSFSVNGQVKPGKRAVVVLQRYDHGKWNAVKKGRSGSNGAFHFSAVAGSTGQHYFRVLARGGKTNLDGPSRHILLKVVKPSGGGGGSTPSDPPDTPPDQPPGPTG